MLVLEGESGSESGAVPWLSVYTAVARLHSDDARVGLVPQILRDQSLSFICPVLQSYYFTFHVAMFTYVSTDLCSSSDIMRLQLVFFVICYLLQQLCVQSRPLAVNMTLPAFAAEHQRLQLIHILASPFICHLPLDS